MEKKQKEVQPIEFVECWFVDIEGKLREMIIPTLSKVPPKNYEELLKDDCLNKGANIDGSSVGSAKVENSDLALKPDKNALFELPKPKNPFKKNKKMQRRFVTFCNIFTRITKQIVDVDSRNILDQTIKKYFEPNNLVMKIKLEPEFYLFDKETKKPLDVNPYACVYPENSGHNFIVDLSYECKKLGFPIKVLHHEGGPAQCEIELDFCEVKKACDQFLVFKNLARDLAEKMNIGFTLMPKPFLNEAGSGLHVHSRIFKKDENGNLKNIFGCYDDEKKFSEVNEAAQSYIAGILNHIPAISAICNPSINSYKRLVPHFEAPTVIAWGYRNRTALIRVPSYSSPDDAGFEVRSPDSTANMYLTLALFISAGMEGINKKLVPPPPATENLFDESLEKKPKELPEDLFESVKEFEKDEDMKKVLGEVATIAYVEKKKKSWNDYVHQVVTEYEWKQNLNC